MRFGKLAEHSAPRGVEDPARQLLRAPATAPGSGCSASRPTATGRAWLAAIDREDLLADERFATRPGAGPPTARELIAELDVAFASATDGRVGHRFDAHDVWWAPINTPAECSSDPQAIASGAFVDMTPRDGEAPYRAVASPIDFDGEVQRPGPVPTLGEHTEAVLTELGYTPAEIAAIAGP